MRLKWVALHATWVMLTLAAIAGCDAPCPPETSTSASGSGGGREVPGGTGSGGFDAAMFPSCGEYASTHLYGVHKGFVLDQEFKHSREFDPKDPPHYVRIDLETGKFDDMLTDSRIDMEWSVTPDADHWAPVAGLLLLPNDPAVYRFKPGSKVFLPDRNHLFYELVMAEGHLFGCTQ